jgi:acetolactate decarboxylase
MSRQANSIHPLKMPLRKYLLILFICCFAGLSGCAPLPSKTYGVITQVSTYPALQRGLYHGEVTYAQLAQVGDFGVGTFDGLDGEMIALDGKFYQAKTDGSVRLADPTVKTPFADVHFFRSQQQLHLNEPVQNYDQLKAYLAKQLPTTNRPYAFKITSNFPTLKIRSVAKQSEPYPPLTAAVAQQTVFELHNITGTLVGYTMPDYLGGIGVAGYHFHFISGDKQHGGHLLDCSLTEATVEIDYLDKVTLFIPQNAAFQGTDFTKPQQ